MLCLSLRLLKTTSYGVLSSSEISTFQNCLRKAHVLSVSLSLSSRNMTVQIQKSVV
jgi:hypothetical protein